MNTEMELKKPFVVNGVSIQNEKLNFISFQLNTMNFRNNNGIRNIVYIEKSLVNFEVVYHNLSTLNLLIFHFL